MTPATQNFDIYKGARWEHTLTFKETGTGTPIDLTGRTPFVLTIKKARTDETLFNGTATVTTPASGVVVVLITSAQSDTLSEGAQVRYGLRDAQNNPYMVGLLNVKYFAPEPA